MKYKLLVLDIDDTIVPTDGNTPSPAVRTAIESVKQLLHISFATARGEEDIVAVADALGIRHTYHVVENGAKVLTPQGNASFRYHISAKETQRILDVCAGLYDEVGFCCDSRWVNEVATPQEDTISVISLISFSKESAAAIPDRLGTLPQQYSSTPGKHWRESSWGLTLISHEMATKGKGISHVQKMLGILPSETISIGDGTSDLTVFPYAGLKVAMHNGDQVLKEAADYIAPSVAEDGVADVINRFILSHDQ